MTIFSRGKPTTSVTQSFKDLTNDETKHYFANDTVYFALNMVGPTPEKMLDATYFTFKISEAHYTKLDNSIGFNVSYTPIEYELCGDKFPYSNKSIYDRIGISTYICPKNTNFFIRANFNSDNYVAIQIALAKCSGSNCQTDEAINNILNTHSISIQMISAYFDFNDYSKPIKTSLQDANIIYLNPNYSTFTRYGVYLNEVSTNDNLFMGSQGTTN